MHALQQQRQPAGSVPEHGGEVQELYEGVRVQYCVKPGTKGKGKVGRRRGGAWGREGAMYDMREGLRAMARALH